MFATQLRPNVIDINKGTVLTVFTSTPVSLLYVQYINGEEEGGSNLCHNCAVTMINKLLTEGVESNIGTAEIR